jgi:DNA-binding PadR family transcriptional regulator
MAKAREPRVLTLSGKESLILDLLLQEGEMYGLQLVAKSKRQLKRGTVYVTLGRMEAKGYIRSTVPDGPPPGGGLPRPRYSATPLGRQVMARRARASRWILPEFAR